MVSLYATLRTLRLYKKTTSVTVGTGTTIGIYNYLIFDELVVCTIPFIRLISLLGGASATIFCLIIL